MRGKVAVHSFHLCRIGITPAYAGKSQSLRPARRPARDHPRICGEKYSPGHRWPIHRGSPPHMRGKALAFKVRVAFLGITPAYAGKSAKISVLLILYRDHPRICGEKPRRYTQWRPSLGSPPHMRGKATGYSDDELSVRITPAYAGKRQNTGCKAESRKDHPRICGEKTKKIP